MSQSGIEGWTTEDVQRWLMTKVKVSQSCADKFVKEEVSGECLVSFEKTDILDLGIKHGPAVKITCHLKSLTEAQELRSEYPAYLEAWTKKQVSQWLLDHVKIYNRYAEQLLDQDVSGDCLVCFRKQDFLDLNVKSGPAVKILAELKKLNQGPEPALLLTLPTSPDQREADEHVQPDKNLLQTLANKPDFQKKTGSQEDTEITSTKREEERPELEDVGAKQKAAMVRPLPESLQSTAVIQNFLDYLLKEDLKKFHFHLSLYKQSKVKAVPHATLEGKDTIDTAQLLTSHYGGQEALGVTRDILSEINQRELACQLERSMGQLDQLCLSRDIKKTEANQGVKLKMLLTCGGHSLDSYDRFVVVVNKSSPDQIQYLKFLTKLKLFCVLDFDPDSVTVGGLCHSYRESRVANLHFPGQFQGQTEAVIKGLNLYLQTSWVFCNGRHDIDGNSTEELDYKSWLRKYCRDVEQLVSFICNPDVFLHGRCLIIFLLLSNVDTEKNPVFDTYKSFIKHTDESNIISICESQSIYLKWRELIEEKCEFDIAIFSINELTLSEINGTVMGLGPVTQSSTRLLPSYGSSSVVLKQKDEDLLTVLDVLCLNECENIYDETSTEFHEFKIAVEEKFYRGAKVKWWNFYFCDKDIEKPFIKRDKYESVKKMIQSQRTQSSNSTVLLRVFHDPGCGGTTLAKHVMWDLRREFRCAVLKVNTVPKTEVAKQVQHLMMLETKKPSSVLLLVDDLKETENPFELLNCICQTVEDLSDIYPDDTQTCKLIILNCVRSHNPVEQYKQHNPTQNQILTSKLTHQEQKEFEKKLKELKETHDKPENFYSFMFMKNNFDKKYTENLAHNTLENFDLNTKKAKLFSFMALLNTFVAKSEIALSLCEDFLQMKMICWKEDSVLDRMKPYSNFLIIESVDEWGGYKGVRIHHAIASACLDELERRHHQKVSDIVMEILHYDLFFNIRVVKHSLMLSIHRMLIERQLKKDGEEREPFSPLINKIHSQKGRQVVQEIFVKASSRFETSLSIPQALARYLYIKVRDFPEALKWAEKAKNIKENPYTFDTIGQIHKTNLRCNVEREKQESLLNPEDLHKNIDIAKNGLRAFQRAQELSDVENEMEKPHDDDSEDYPRKTYNVKGYVSILEISFLVFEILSRLPFFDKSEPLKKHYLQSFVKGTIPISHIHKENSAANNRCVEIITEHQGFLLNLKSQVKETFDFLNSFFTYIKQNSDLDGLNHRIVTDHFKKYVDLFCATTDERRKEQENKTSLSLKLDIEERKWFLEKNQADTFSGILQYLDKPADQMEQITECYAFLLLNAANERHYKTKINYIMSNIVLYHLRPKSKHVKKYTELRALLQDVLQDVGLQHAFPDPYFLALLLFWPSPTEENNNIAKFATAIRKSSHKNLSKLFQKRNTVAYFYLGKEEGLKRLVSKRSLDKGFLLKMLRDDLAQLWRNGEIFREKAIINRLHRVRGIIEQGEVYANYGKEKILVRPARISGIRSGFSTENVSFYVGFAINGLLAYDIKYKS